jgi:acyl carrier protein
MGVDLLDIHFRLEKALGIRLPRTSLYWTRQEREAGSLYVGKRDVTAGEVHVNLCETLAELGHEVPANSREIVRACLGEALGFAPEEVKPEHLLIRDLGAS